MITAFRVIKEKHIADAFLGEGSRRFGGRWNHKGTAVTYLSDTLALAALEQFIHLGHEGLHIPFVYIKIEIPDSVSVSSIKSNDLPKDWRKEPPPNSTKNLGTQWARSKSSAILQVPAAIIPIGFNYIVNVNHPETTYINIGDPIPFSFDPRMWK